jgi:hypothetical protein
MTMIGRIRPSRRTIPHPHLVMTVTDRPDLDGSPRANAAAAKIRATLRYGLPTISP